MIAINSGVRYVLYVKWLEDSSKAKKAIDVKSLAEDRYVVRDTEKEKLWRFSMANTLGTPRGKDHRDGGVFAGYAIYVTDGIVGKVAPPVDEMRKVIESGGGTWLDALPPLAATGGEGDDVVIISTDTHIKKVKNDVSMYIARLAGEGRLKGIYTPDFIYLTVLRQSLDLQRAAEETAVQLPESLNTAIKNANTHPSVAEAEAEAEATAASTGGTARQGKRRTTTPEETEPANMARATKRRR
jgi:hypothetical protein